MKKGNDFSVSLDYDPRGLLLRRKSSTLSSNCSMASIPQILYVWGNGVHEKKGDKSSPYTETVKMFVLENGGSHLYKWRIEERNILEDFKEVRDIRMRLVGYLTTLLFQKYPRQNCCLSFPPPEAHPLLVILFRCRGGKMENTGEVVT